jgi:hypothetical protein
MTAVLKHEWDNASGMGYIFPERPKVSLFRCTGAAVRRE